MNFSGELCSRALGHLVKSAGFSTTPAASQIILLSRLRVVDNSAIGKQAMLDGRPPKCIQVYNKTQVGTIGDKKLSTSACCRKKQKKESGGEFTSTVILPNTTFPLRISPEDRAENDKNIAEIAGFDSLYQWQRDNRPVENEFVLHDGPPYANGRLHLGHAVNKILKDSINRYKVLRGHRVDYRPGWDCHGLPIELKAITSQSSQISPPEIRQKSRNFAKQAMQHQMEGFRSWGVMADWSKETTYRTFDPEYVKSEMRTFYALYEKGLVYRDYKPVFWSPSSRTSLAEAELEYNANHTSISIHVRFEAVSIPESLRERCIEDLKLYIPIWTTTPWTLPANVAVAFSPTIEYHLVHLIRNSEPGLYVVAKELLETFVNEVQAEFKVLGTVTESELLGLSYAHPLSGKHLPLVPSSHVTTEKGTGFVHTAPAHGPEDFEAAQKFGLPTLDLVDEGGKFRAEAGKNLHGLDIFEEGQATILQLLEDSVMKREKFVHSYPYDWRTKQPVIYRASLQWFIDTEKIRADALEKLAEVNLKPNSLAHDLKWEVTRRPPWCISRQRSWGVPIPVLYAQDGTPVVSKSIVDRACSLVDKEGLDSWWTSNVADIAGSEDALEKNTEILDIWLDSGLSWLNVLGLEKQADVYVEGLDQCRGWFQSSLLTSIALRGIAPYKAVLAHGFVLDENGKKMSKSLGNVIDPEDILRGDEKVKKAAMGVDVLRWWALSHRNLADPIRAGDSIFAMALDEVHTIRKTFRFMLGALNNCRGDELSSVPVSELQLIDRYLLHLLGEFSHAAIAAFDAHDTRKVCSSLLQLLVRDVSTFYFWITKDRLYCEAKDSPNRLSSLVVIYHLLRTLGAVTSPIMPHLTEEIHQHMPKELNISSFSKAVLEYSDPTWNQPEVAERVKNIFQIRDELNTSLVGINTVQLKLDFAGEKFANSTTGAFTYKSSTPETQMSEIFKVSETSFNDPNSEAIATKSVSVDNEVVTVTVSKSLKHKCPRCRLLSSSVAGTVCPRCESVVKALRT